MDTDEQIRRMRGPGSRHVRRRLQDQTNRRGAARVRRTLEELKPPR